MRSSRDRLEKGEEKKNHSMDSRAWPTWKVWKRGERESRSVPDPGAWGQGVTRGMQQMADIAGAFNKSKEKAMVGHTLIGL